MKIKSLIVDDEQGNIENLHGILQQHFLQIDVCATAHDVATAFEYINYHEPQLLFLDIQLAGETGFDLLKKFTAPDFEVIFITAYEQYGIQAIKFSALDYLLKPVTAKELKPAIEKLTDKIIKKQKDLNLDNLLTYFKTINKEQRKIALPLQNEIRYIPLHTINRFEASSNYTKVFIKDEEALLVCKTLKDFVNILESCGFIRCHQSHLVNIHFIKSYLKEDGGRLLLIDKMKIPISKAYKEIVKKTLNETT